MDAAVDAFFVYLSREREAKKWNFFRDVIDQGSWAENESFLHNIKTFALIISLIMAQLNLFHAAP